MTFEQLKLIQDPSTHKFERTKKIQEAYDRKLKLLGMAGITPENHILAKWAGSDQSWYTPNEFPYDFENAMHMIVWIKNNSTADFFIKHSIDHADKKKYIVFENKQKTKSVKRLRHFHVIVKD